MSMRALNYQLRRRLRPALSCSREAIFCYITSSRALCAPRKHAILRHHPDA